MIRTDQDAITVARRLAASKGIVTYEVLSVKRVAGTLRAKYLPDKDTDYWIVSFRRSTHLLEGVGVGLSDLERELIESFATENDSIAIGVEIDGTATVV
jgi:hypothetical protein